MKCNQVGAAFLAVLLFSAGRATAAGIEGVKLPDAVRGEGGAELVLNGAGVRTRIVFKVYVGALYLQKKTVDAKSVLADPGAKRVAMHLLRDLSAEQLFTALNEGLRNNHSEADLAKLDPQVKQLDAIFKAVKAAKSGDVILLDYAPGTGTRVTVNGESRGVIAGEEFYRALLRIWVGDEPADAALKKAMLGG